VATRSASGTKTDTPLKEIPQSITVVTSDQVKDQGTMTVQEAVRYVPGTYADAYGPDTRGDYPRVRGSDPNIYLDGTRLVDTYRFGEYRPDPFTLSRIEVLRGPSSVLYGDTATSGLLNLVSKRPQAQSYNEITALYGSYDLKRIQADSTGRLSADGEWLYRIIGIFRDSDYQTDFVKNDRQMIMPAITWRPTTDTSWTVLGTIQKDKSGSSTAFLPHSGTIFPNPNGQIPINRFASEPGFDRYDTSTKSVSSLFEHSFGDVFKVRSNTRYSKVDAQYDTMYPNSYQNLLGLPFFPYVDATQQTVHRFAQIQNTSRDILTTDNHGELNFATGLATHKLLFGFDARRLKERIEQGVDLNLTPFNLYNPVYGEAPFFAQSGGPTFPVTRQPDARQSLYGLYLQDQMRFGPMIFTAGVRHDKVLNEREGDPNQTDSAISKRFGLVYETPWGINPYISYSESFNPVFGSNVCANGFCQPVRGEMYEAGVKYQLTRTSVFNAAVFDITERNRLMSGPDPVFQIQTGEAKIRGLELEYLGEVTPDLSLIASYSYIDARVTVGDVPGARVDGIPANYASLWAKYRFGLFGVPGFSVGAGVRYIGESWSTGVSPVTGLAGTITTPSHTLFDAMVAWENANWRFQVNASNLTDKVYFATCLTRGDCFYGTRRTVVSSLTYRF
jgi:iron complex outermembrane receptor protein